jgi:hypothetical protein
MFIFNTHINMLATTRPNFNHEPKPPRQMTQKVFISSTYGDLVPFRKKIWEDLNHLPIEILGMEKFGARKSAPLVTCLEEVTKSDIFICIIAFRFG